ncbi:hypothetical protein RZS08_59935, partial [Arthrospira platensis SPKY1]|nr:hypothetical protein [Arthrospira platensis SPKY1]
MARYMGYRDSLFEIERWMRSAQRAADYLWCPHQGAYVARDLRTGRHAKGISSVAFLSFYAGIANSRRD